MEIEIYKQASPTKTKKRNWSEWVERSLRPRRAGLPVAGKEVDARRMRWQHPYAAAAAAEDCDGEQLMAGNCIRGRGGGERAALSPPPHLASDSEGNRKKKSFLRPGSHPCTNLKPEATRGAFPSIAKYISSSTPTRIGFHRRRRRSPERERWRASRLPEAAASPSASSPTSPTAGTPLAANLLFLTNRFFHRVLGPSYELWGWREEISWPSRTCQGAPRADAVREAGAGGRIPQRITGTYNRRHCPFLYSTSAVGLDRSLDDFFVFYLHVDYGRCRMCSRFSRRRTRQWCRRGGSLWPQELCIRSSSITTPGLSMWVVWSPIICSCSKMVRWDCADMWFVDGFCAVFLGFR